MFDEIAWLTSAQLVPTLAAAWVFASALGLFGMIAKNPDARTKRALAA